jgi:hypothetical protein
MIDDNLMPQTTVVLKSTNWNLIPCSWESLLLITQSVYYQPNGVVLDVLSIEAGVKIHHWFKCTQHTVDSNKQKFELSVGRAMGQSFFQQSQCLPHSSLIP